MIPNTKILVPVKSKGVTPCLKQPRHIIIKFSYEHKYLLPTAKRLYSPKSKKYG